MTTEVQALIVGAGISGLACAYALRKSGIDAQVVESSPRPGGLIRSERRDGYLLELGPQSFTTTPKLLQLCRDLGIENELVTAPPRAPRFLLLDGKLKPAPLNPPAFFASSLFSARTKRSILRDLFGRTTPPTQDESIAAFTRRKFTPELLDKLVGPFISGIYAGDPEKLSLRAAFPQLFDAERTSGSIIRGMMRAAKSSKTANGPKKRPALQSFRDGNETLVKALAANLGLALRTETTVTELQRTPSATAVNYELTLVSRGSTQKISAENLILATPTDVSANLLRNLHPSASSALASIEYAPVAVVSLGYSPSAIEGPLNGFGFLIPRSEKLRTLGTVWNSSLFPNRAPTGHMLLTSFIGGATDPQAIALSRGELTSLVHKEIAPLLQLRETPAVSNVAFYSCALPQYNLGHSERLASLHKLREELPGLWLVGNYLRGPSIGACIEQSLSMVTDICTRIKSGTSPVRI
jgi:protoporphyrinogen/coproporphyrinogen III oxidase